MNFNEFLQIGIGLLLGIGLSAAAGFRVFMPFLCLSAASYFGVWQVPVGMQWAGTLPALILFGTATMVEIAAYYIPWVDNILDTISTPVAVIAGSVLTASALSHEVSPMVQWSAGIIAGGATAGIVSSGTAITRVASSVTTGGIANPLLSTSEIGGSVLLSIFAMMLPILTGCLVLVLLFFTIRFLWKKVRTDKHSTI